MRLHSYRFDSGPGHKENVENQHFNETQTTFLQKVEQKVENAIKLVIPEKLPYMNNISLPYILPQLIIPSKKSKDQRIHVVYHVYDENLGRLIRIRYFKIPGDTHNEQITAAQMVVIPYITNKLVTGYVHNSNKLSNNKYYDPNKLTIIDAVNFAYNLKKARLGTRAKENYSYYINGFIDFVKESNYEKHSIEKFTGDIAREFQNYLGVKGFSNRTTNNFTDTIKTMINVLLKQDNPPLSKNPFINIDKVKAGMGKNIAFNKEQKRLIFEYSKEKWPQAYFLAVFMYYTLMRTNEICTIQRKHIGYVQPGYIYLEGVDNSKRIFSRNIQITDRLAGIFKEFGILDLPPETYLFSKDRMLPGPEKLETKRMGGKYREWILDMIPELKGKREYTLYSWKHTGVIGAYISGIAPHNIMRQTGHRDRQGFETYLKSLGLVTKTDFNEKMPDPEDF